MKIHCPVRWAVSGAVLSCWCACAGTTPPAESPGLVAERGADAGSLAAPAAAVSEPAPASAAAEAPASTSTDSPLEKPSRPVRQLLETKDTVWFLTFEDSDPGKNAEASCAKASGADPQKNAACLSKARLPFEGIGYRFTRSSKDQTTLTIVRRTDNALSVQHKFRYAYGDETDTATIIKLEGKDEGPVKWEKIAPELKIGVPNDYTLVVQDPKHGRLVYSAKVGIPGD